MDGPLASIKIWGSSWTSKKVRCPCGPLCFRMLQGPICLMYPWGWKWLPRFSHGLEWLPWAPGSWASCTLILGGNICFPGWAHLYYFTLWEETGVTSSQNVPEPFFEDVPQLDHFHFHSGSLIWEDVVITTAHRMFNLEQQVLLSTQDFCEVWAVLGQGSGYGSLHATMVLLNV